MINAEKLKAVDTYFSEEFPGMEISSSYNAARKAQFYEIKSGKTCKKAIVSEEFLEDHDEQDISKTLKKFLLAEHLRECDLTILVTNDGLGEG